MAALPTRSCSASVRADQTAISPRERSSRSCSTSTYSSHPSSSSRRCSMRGSRRRVGWVERRADATRVADARSADPEEIGRLRGDVSLNHVRFSYPVPAERPGFEGGRPVARRGPQDPRLLHPETRLAQTTGGRCAASICRSRQGRHRPRRRNGCREIHSHEAAGTFLRPDEGSVEVDRHDLRTVDLHDFRPSARLRSAGASSSRAPSGTTSRTGAPRPVTPRWRRLPERSARMMSSPASRRVPPTS